MNASPYLSRLRWMTALFCALGLSVTCAASGSTDIESFVRQLYANYALNGPGIPLSGEGAKSFLTPALRQRVERDEHLLRGEVGVLGADPLCACQDFDIRQLDRISTHMNDVNGDANVTVTFHNLGTAQTIELTLARTRDGWRIDDIGYVGMPSVRQSLEREIQELSGKR